MSQKLPNNVWAALEILKGLKEWHHRKIADKPISRPSSKARLSGEEINHKQIRKPTRHTHNQRANPIDPVLFDVFLEYSITGQNIIGLTTNWGALAKERARGAELLSQKR